MLWKILLTTCSSRVWIFFDVWNTMVYEKMPHKIAGSFFGWFSIFVDFCANLNFCTVFRASQGKIPAHFIKFCSLFHYWSHILYDLLLQIIISDKNGLEVFKSRQKIHKYWKSAKKGSCNFVRNLFMYHSVSYIKKNPNPGWISG